MLTRQIINVLSSAVVIFAALSSRSYAIDKEPATKPVPAAIKTGFSTKEKGYYHRKTNYVQVLRNSPTEAVVEYSVKLPKGLGDRVGRWRLLGGKPWVELTSVSHLTMVGMHGESRIIICPDAGGGGDYAFDSLKGLSGKKTTEWIAPPTTSHMLLDPIIDDDTIWAMMGYVSGKVADDRMRQRQVSHAPSYRYKGRRGQVGIYIPQPAGGESRIRSILSLRPNG
ncbi:MAG: hypothetical protein SVV80_07915 [Planctomycetota bacterium]|nr:hypothetical protein [Planctomycetota bacterium]